MMRKSDLEYRGMTRAAKDAARKVIERYAIESADHILLEAIAADLGVEVLEGPLAGAIARLIRLENKGLIRVSTTVTNRARRRFCVAHELGHFVLRHSDFGWLGCAEKEMTDFGGKAAIETQANAFAAELLLPQSIVKPRCDVTSVSLRPVRELAEEFDTSVTSTAIRFVEFCPEMCAVVFSRDNRVVWSSGSESLWCWTRSRGKELDPESGAAQYWRGGSVVDRPQKMASECWLEDKGAVAYEEVVEHSMPIPSADAVLTLLWIQSS
jgi:Zn-dependent peptidase ImmA (M78 family)